MTDLRTQVALVVGEKNPLPIYNGTLADDYDGISEYVPVALSRGAAGAALARIAPGSTLSGQSAPRGTPVSVISIRGHLEVISLGSRTAAGYTVTTLDSGYNAPSIEPISLQSGTLVDYTGNPSVSEVGLTGAWGKLVQGGGIYNGDFELPPTAINVDIGEENVVPYWGYFESQHTGAHLQVIEGQGPFGRILRASLDASSDPGAYLWIGQTIPATAPVELNTLIRFGDSVADSYLFDIIYDWLDLDLRFLTRQGGGAIIGLMGAAGVGQIAEWNLPSGSPPSGAAYVRISIGIRVNTVDTTPRFFDILSVGLVTGLPSNLQLRDSDPLSPDNTSEIYEFARSLRFKANSGGAAGTQPELFLNGDTVAPGIWLFPGGSSKNAAFDPVSFYNATQDSRTITTAGTYYGYTGYITDVIYPAFVGQKFLFLGSLSAYADLIANVTVRWELIEGSTTNDVATLGSSRHRAYDANEWGHHSIIRIWTAPSLDGVRFRPEVTHTTSGAVVDIAFVSLIALPLPI